MVKKKFCKTFKKSQNIMKMITAISDSSVHSTILVHVVNFNYWLDLWLYVLFNHFISISSQSRFFNTQELFLEIFFGGDPLCVTTGHQLSSGAGKVWDTGRV